MGNIASSFISALKSAKPYKLVFIGLDGAGKTTILYRLARNKVENTVLTIGFNVEVINFQGWAVTGWDVGGRSSMRPLWRFYAKDSEGIVFVVDAGDPYRLDQARDELHRGIDTIDCDGKGLPVLVYANKQDLPNALQIEDLQDRLQIDRLKPKRQCRFVPCIATTGKGLHEGLQWLRDSITNAENNGTIVTEKEVEVLASAKHPVPGAPIASSIGFDPVKNNATLQSFLPIKNGTECPFAKSAKLWGGSEGSWENSETVAANARALSDFVRQSNAGQNLDGFCVALPSNKDVSPQMFGQQVRQILTYLGDLDPVSENSLRNNYIGNRGWRYRYAGAGFFVTTFAPCYPPTSSRYAFGIKDRCFIMLQPELSFLRHKLPSDTPKTTDPPQTIRDKTRLSFRDAGRSYHIPKTTQYPPAEHIVKPLKDDGATVIYWWLEKSSNTIGNEEVQEEKKEVE